MPAVAAALRRRARVHATPAKRAACVCRQSLCVRRQRACWNATTRQRPNAVRQMLTRLRASRQASYAREQPERVASPLPVFATPVRPSSRPRLPLETGYYGKIGVVRPPYRNSRSAAPFPTPAERSGSGVQRRRARRCAAEPTCTGVEARCPPQPPAVQTTVLNPQIEHTAEDLVHRRRQNGVPEDVFPTLRAHRHRSSPLRRPFCRHDRR